MEKKSVDDFKAYGAYIRPANKGPDSVRYGIKWLQGLNHIYIDSKYCPETYKEFINYEYDTDGHGNFISSYPDKNNHSIDACLEKNSKVHTENGLISISELINTTGKLYAYDIENDKIVLTDYKNCRITKHTSELLELILDTDEHIHCTSDHRILTHNRGYVEAQYLTTDDNIVFIGNTSHSAKLVSISKYTCDEDVYDLEVPNYHNFIINSGTVVHNCRYALQRYWRRKGN